MKGSYVICDSSSLISLTSSCLENLMYFFKDNFGTRFIMPKSVEHESVERPLSFKTKVHWFSALRIKDMINDGTMEIVSDGLKDETRELLQLGNKIFYARGKPVNILHLGETEMLALANKLNVDAVLMDERTTRVLVEEPLVLRDHLQEEFGTNIMVNKKALSDFSSKMREVSVMRSTELLYVAYEHGFLGNFEGIEAEAAEAALYKLKYSGCAISFRELEGYLGMME